MTWWRKSLRPELASQVGEYDMKLSHTVPSCSVQSKHSSCWTKTVSLAGQVRFLATVLSINVYWDVYKIVEQAFVLK